VLRSWTGRRAVCQQCDKPAPEKKSSILAKDTRLNTGIPPVVPEEILLLLISVCCQIRGELSSVSVDKSLDNFGVTVAIPDAHCLIYGLVVFCTAQGSVFFIGSIKNCLKISYL
jgi:hypothetical protein